MTTCYLVHSLVESRRNAHPGLTVIIQNAGGIASRCEDPKLKGLNAAFPLSAREAARLINTMTDGFLFLADDFLTEKFSCSVSLRDDSSRPPRILQLVTDQAERLSQHSLSLPRYHASLSLWQRLKPKAVLCRGEVTISAKALTEICKAFYIPLSSVSRLYGLPAPNVAVDAVMLARNHDKFPTILELLVCKCQLVMAIMPCEMVSERIANCYVLFAHILEEARCTDPSLSLLAAR